MEVLNNPKHTQDVAKQLQDLLNIKIVPGGLYDFTNDKKEPVGKYALFRPSEAEWARYPNDTVAKHYLDGTEYFVVDIDIPDALQPDNTLEWTHNDITYRGVLPDTLYTTTTQEYKRHYYYSISHLTQVQKETLRCRKILSGVDLLGLGWVFEGHARPTQSITIREIAPLPRWIYDIVSSSKQSTQYLTQLTPSSKPGPAKLIQQYLADSSSITHKQMKTLVRICFAKDDIPEGKRGNKTNKLSFTDIPLNHTTMNNVATKLTMIAELGHTEHVIPMIEAIVSAHGKDPQSSITQQHMASFFSTLPTHEPIDVDEDNATLTFYELCHKQHGNVAVFEVSGRTREFVLIDKITYRPIELPDGTYTRQQAAMEGDFPQYRRQNEEGTKTWYDWPIFPMAELRWDIRGSRILPSTSALDRIVINTYTAPAYKEEAEPIHTTNNVIYRAFESMVSEEHMPFMLHWMAYAVFSNQQLLTIPVMISSEQGTGKSTLLWKIPHLLTGAFYSISATTMRTGWGDIYTSSSGLCLDDISKLSHKEWEEVYATLKNMTNGGTMFLNKKGGAMMAADVHVNLTITSNKKLPFVDKEDRRLFCIEPAHLTGNSEPLSDSDARLMELIKNSKTDEVNPHVMEFANLLKYIYTTTSTPDGMCKDTVMNGYMFNKAPETVWREEWITGSSSHSKNLYNFINQPDKLMGLIKDDMDMIGEFLSDHIELIIISYSSKHNTVGLSWYWFREMLPLVSSNAEKLSKNDVEGRLGVEMTTNVGLTYTDAWKTHSNEEMRKHTAAGYVIHMDRESIDRYKEILKELRN